MQEGVEVEGFGEEGDLTVLKLLGCKIGTHEDSRNVFQSCSRMQVIIQLQPIHPWKEIIEEKELWFEGFDDLEGLKAVGDQDGEMGVSWDSAMVRNAPISGSSSTMRIVLMGEGPCGHEVSWCGMLFSFVQQ